jgi:hypothetical protein
LSATGVGVGVGDIVGDGEVVETLVVEVVQPVRPNNKVDTRVIITVRVNLFILFLLRKTVFSFQFSVFSSYFTEN